ncbi:uncharacterized protein [Physcomitrium patens]|uniref:DUF220 domain-containing protein n=1 Tax=Physcomitrium patens TaxID=3218 RepID=A9RFP1_PHYPA|nr:uncharacterized protein LOC112277716 [Physcomitrium patens]PNR27106.1 hypothetical protein PHYPA_030587 [Physcomitrium patens]|eukprot:XP_024366129.1 uncharacterized protein LOC112277716 [Physcomitrella patens]
MEVHSDNGEVKALDGVEGEGKSVLEDEAWESAEFVHEPPMLKITQPKGSFCQIDARFSVALPPDGVFNIITDPNNRRVFKNIKEVVYRKVLEDDGNRQLVEVEQLGRWRFLMLSGTFSSRVIVEQNREEKLMLFDLSRQGMMKKFSGSWKIEPMLASELSIGSRENNATPGSWVNFQQVLEPAIVPPWPLNGYVRGVTERIIREMLADLQLECLRLSQVNNS